MPRHVLVVVLLALSSAGASFAESLRYPEIPPLSRAPSDPANRPTRARRNLGAELFFDARLSGSGNTSCAACHLHTTNWQDNLRHPRPDASQGQNFFLLKDNTDSLLNIVYRPFFFRDGRHQNLGNAFPEPFIEDNQRLGIDRPDAAAHLAAILRGRPGYVARFQRAFRQDIRTLADEQVMDLAGDAMAAFATRLVTATTPFDRWNRGQGSISAAAERGVALFVGKAHCVHCHVGPNLSDGKFHNVSTSLPDELGQRVLPGREHVTHDPADGGKFLTPTLRQVVMTSPYFASASAFTILDVINHFDAGAGADPDHDPLVGTPLGLTAQEKSDLFEFLRTLRSRPKVVRGPTGPLCDDAAVARLRARLP